jgi:hypothetical protein
LRVANNPILSIENKIQSESVCPIGPLGKSSVLKILPSIASMRGPSLDKSSPLDEVMPDKKLGSLIPIARSINKTSMPNSDPSSEGFKPAICPIENPSSESFSDKVPIISLACAHPAKFPDAVKTAIGFHPELPSQLDDLLNRKEYVIELPNNFKMVSKYIADNTNV